MLELTNSLYYNDTNILCIYKQTENTHAGPIFINETAATCHLPCCRNVVSCNNTIMNYCNNTIMYQLLVLVYRQILLYYVITDSKALYMY